MSSFWTVTPNKVKRIELDFLGRPFWIEVKEELTSGERTRIDASGISSYSRRADAPSDGDDMTLAMQMNVNLELAKFTKMSVWLAAWSLTDDDGAALPRSVETLRALKDGLGEIIEAAIDAHAKEVREAGKKPATTVQGTQPSPQLVKTSS